MSNTFDSQSFNANSLAARILWFLLPAITIVVSIGVVFAASLLAMRLCVWFAYTHEEQKLIVEIIPVLEKMVWPLLLLILFFLHRDEIKACLHELPGLIERSYLPYSPAPAQAIPTKDNDVTDMAEAMNNANAGRQGNGVQDSIKFDQIRHEKIVAEIFKSIERDEGISITPYVRMLNSQWVCNGAFVFCAVTCYVAVLPCLFIDRIPIVIERMNGAVNSMKIRNRLEAPMLMICLYDFESSDKIGEIDLQRYRNIANHKVSFRFFLKSQLKS